MTSNAVTPGSSTWSSESLYDLAVRTALVAGVFSVLACVMLAIDYHRRSATDPLESTDFRQLKKELAAAPKDEVLKARIRDLDQRLRREYFGQRSFALLGSGLLGAGALVTLLSSRWAAALRRKFPQPVAAAVPVDPEIRVKGIARWAVGAVGAAIGVAAMLMAIAIRTPLTRMEAETATTTVAALAESAVTSDAAAPKPSAGSVQPAASVAPSPVAAAGYPSNEELCANWPRFRGPEGRGVSTDTNVPTAWNVAAGKGVAWKAPVPLPGHNSPIIWGDRVMLSGADATKRQVFCFDAAGGKLLWQTDVPATPKSPASFKPYGDTGYAASTMATDGRRVYAIFATGDLAALDLNGKVVWVQSLGLAKSSYSYASSLATYRNLVLVLFDQGEERDHLSKLLALDGATGKLVWETPRPVPNSWSTPIVFRHGNRDLLVASGEPWVIAYNPADGKEVWRVKCLKQDIGPSPTYSAGLVFAVNSAPHLSAIRADGQGDITQTNVAWTGEDGLPDTCSPLATGQFVMLLGDGILTGYDIKSGKKLWEKDLDGAFKSSPAAAGKFVYVTNEDGKAWVLEPGPSACKEVGSGEFGEKCMASPAFHKGRLYMRGEKTLFCIGNP